MSAKSNERHKDNEAMSEYGRATPNVKVSVTRHFDASPERVFDAWLDPEMIGKWMFGPALREEEVLRIVADARVGGSFSFLVRRQGQEIDHVGKYREIDRPRRLIFTWGIAGESEDESLVIIEIVPQGAGAELTLTHEMDAKWADYASRTEAGWTKMLEALAAALGQIYPPKSGAELIFVVEN